MTTLFIKKSTGLGGVETSNKYISNTNLNKKFSDLSVVEIDLFDEISHRIKESESKLDTCIIESNILVVDTFENLYKVLKCNPNTKFYLRINSSPLGFNMRTNMHGCEFDEFTEDFIQKLQYMRSCNKNVGIIVVNKMDYFLMKYIGFSEVLHIELPTVTYNSNKDTTDYHSVNRVRKLLYVSGYYNKNKGILSMLHAINSTNEGEFEWHIVSPFNRSEYLYDYDHISTFMNHVLHRNDVIVHSITNDLIPYYKECDTVVIPAYFETHSFTAWEALSWGCKVIALNSMNLPWMNNPKVHLVDINNYDYLSAGIGIAELARKLNNNESIPKVIKNEQEIISRYLLSRYDSGIIDNKLQYFS